MAQTLAESGSMHNTPATFSIYVAGLVFQWVLRNGGLEAMEQASLRRAAALYQAIDESRHFRYAATVAPHTQDGVATTRDTRWSCTHVRSCEQGERGGRLALQRQHHVPRVGC
mgnify:CR=1 FL=1